MTSLSIRKEIEMVRESSYGMALLKDEDKGEALQLFADLIDKSSAELIAANRRDLEESQGKIAKPLMDRLKLDEQKLVAIRKGLLDLAKMPDPIGRVTLRRKLDEGLELERLTVPLGVIAVIFESRPDVIPQIAGLILKSGNAVVLKGGAEAIHSHRAFMRVIAELNRQMTFFPAHWATLLETRADVQEILSYDDLIQLIVPRGSNELVRSIKANTRIPVMGHADGVCHLYVHESADLALALNLVRDGKTQYPSACNSIETLLVDRTVAKDFLTKLASSNFGITLLGCDEAQKILPGLQPASEQDWRTEYGDERLSVKVVTGLGEAIQHINAFGSHHTDAIVASNPFVCEVFLNAVDSASVFANASTRFADGFRYGFGAEVGISTDRLHARGPVGIEGLTTYKYKLRGHGQLVKDYVGEKARPFLHEDLK